MLKTKVMTIANKLVGKGCSRSVAMVKAWVIVKAAALRVKVVGVTKLFRQEAIRSIQEVGASNLEVTFKHERYNRYDSNAIAVYSAIKGQAIMLIGYLPKAVAGVVAPLMDKGAIPTVKSINVVGGFNQYVRYGVRLQVTI